MAVSVSPRMGVTADEVVHLTGGYSYWKFNDYRLHPENGTLPMRLAALPLLGMDLRFPSLDDPNWLNSKVNIVGEKFFYQLGNPLDRMLLAGRAMIAIFGVLACWLTWRWARGLFGPAAGWLALILAVFSPSLLAQGGLITSDMAFTACACAALSSIWLLLHRATWSRLLAAIIACGACFLSKMSGAIIVPLIVLLLLLRWLRPAPYVWALGRVRWLRRRSQRYAATFLVLTLTAAGSLTLVWANYSFRFEGANRAHSGFNHYYFSWDVLMEKEKIPSGDVSALVRFVAKRPPMQATALTRLIGKIRDARLLPEAYLWGFAHTHKFSRERPAFFLGDYRTTGWALFFPVAFLMKTTLPALLLFVAGVAAAIRLPCASRHDTTGAILVRRSLAYRAAPLILFFVVYWILAVRMTLNLGHRHIVPVYPAFYVFAAASVLWLGTRNRRMVGFALIAAAGLHAVDSWAARPFYLAYFQPLVGGRERAYHYLVESSLDWGQGLPDLKAWLANKQRRGDPTPVFLSYFGADSPRARQLDVIRFGDEMSDSGERIFPAPFRGGWYVISATSFRRAFLPMRGSWEAPQEELYRELLANVNERGGRQDSLTPAERELLVRDTMDLETLQFCRLCKWLERREPLELVGGSLLVFKLTDAEVATALYGPLPVSDVFSK